jgi:hypothetical protein
MAAQNGVEARQALKGGAIAGLIGGAVLSIFMVLMNITRGEDPWVPLKGAAYPILGPVVFEPGPAPLAIVLAVAIHFALSIGWGLLFGVFFYGLSKWATLLVSLVWGVVVWLVMFYVALPLVGAGDMVGDGPKAIPILEHMLFGLSVGLGFLPFQHTRTRPVTHTRGRHIPVTSP